jgi:transcriptional regulator with XRE-family HTH domain
MARLPDRPGKRIRELREERGWSQVDLAKRSGVSKQAISKIEAPDSDHVGRFDSLHKLAAALGVHISNLFGAAPTATPGIPLGAEVTSEVGLVGSTVSTIIHGTHRGYSTPKETVPVADARAGWFAARVATEASLTATLDTSPPVAHDLRPGDVLVFRPLEDGEVIAPGRVVWVTRGEDESELRVWRELDRKSWCWPFDGTDQRPERADEWTVRGMMVELRRGYE